jgi:hypothetical protein
LAGTSRCMCLLPSLKDSHCSVQTFLVAGCAPGYFSQPDAINVCEACPKNSWCPGGVGAAAAKNLCGSCLMTGTPLAQNNSACITQPGCGYRPDGSGDVCSIGTYSSGNNQQPCTPCPAGMTTVAARSESVAACMAPAGYFFQVWWFLVPVINLMRIASDRDALYCCAGPLPCMACSH